jgi:uncharacterized protein DUF6599
VSQQPERVFNTFRRKPFRPFYSIREFYSGIILLLLLAAILFWVRWRGHNPDPELFMSQEKLLSSKGAEVPVYKRPLERWVEPGIAPTQATAATNTLEPFPASIVSEGWQANRAVEMFDATDVYKKIDGREGFYKSFGFQKLYTISLDSTSKKGLTLDIELFDLGSIDNALGAMTAEISDPKTNVKLENAGLSYSTTNGGFASQGRYYIRMIGSDADPAIQEKVKSLKIALLPHFPAEKLPWTYALFVGQLGVSPGQIKYEKENAFSLSFVDNVYTATVPGSTETSYFISKRPDEKQAGDLAKELAKSFSEYGKILKQSPLLISNDYIQAVDGIQTYRDYVIGVRYAKTEKDAVDWMNRLKAALQKVS